MERKLSSNSRQFRGKALVQRAIDNGVLDKNTDESSLMSIANYLLYGKIIEKGIVENGEIKYVRDEQMTGIANKIWIEFITPINERNRNEEIRNEKKPKKDNTSKSGNGF